MFGRTLEQVLSAIFEFARAKRHRFVTLEHLLLALLDNPEARALLEACGANIERLRTSLDIYIEENTAHMLPAEKQDIQPNLDFQIVMQHAIEEVKRAGGDTVTGVNVLLAIFSERDSQSVYFLSQENVTHASALSYSLGGMSKAVGSTSRDINPFQDLADGADLSPPPLVQQEENITDLYTTNLNEKAALGKIDPLIGRSEELSRAMQVLSRRNKNNPLFVGEAGVGKTAVAEGIAQLIVDKKVPDSMLGCTVYSLDLGVLLAGTKYRGDFEKRFKAILKALNKQTGAIVFIDEIHNLIGAGSATGGTLDASNLIKPLLSSGELRCMGATTYEEYRKYFVKDAALSRRFQKIDISEPTQEETTQILHGIKGRYELYHHIRYSDESINRAAELSARYLPDRHMPDKAIDLLDEAGACQHIYSEKKRVKEITRKEIDEVFSGIARIPINDLQQSDKNMLCALSLKLKKLIFGQDHAVEKICNSIKLSRSGLARPDKPVGSFLLIGPTGVGKTALMHSLSEELNIEFLRFDMSEYMEKHSVSKLIGAPPGYVGFDEGGMLSEAVRKHPHAVLLLDEIEKAHSDIYNILLQVMDYGHLTDSNGMTIDFRHVIIAMTSNVGSDCMEKNTIGFSGGDEVHGVEEAVKRVFSPEFRNRLDDIVQFDYLGEKVIMKVVDKFIKELRQQMKAKEMKLTISSAAKKILAALGYDKKMGARPMSRVIQEKIRLPIAELLLDEDDESNIQQVNVGVNKGELVITVQKKNELMAVD